MPVLAFLLTKIYLALIDTHFQQTKISRVTAIYYGKEIITKNFEHFLD